MTQREIPIDKISNYGHSFNIANTHNFGCPVCMLDHRLQNGEKIPRWEPRHRLGIFVGNSLLYADNVALL